MEIDVTLTLRAIEKHLVKLEDYSRLIAYGHHDPNMQTKWFFEKHTEFVDSYKRFEFHFDDTTKTFAKNLAEFRSGMAFTGWLIVILLGLILWRVW